MKLTVDIPFRIVYIISINKGTDNDYSETYRPNL